jgi:hypothetical protein
MRKTLLAALSLVLASVRSGSAHQLDEYLQATRIAIEHDRVVLEMSLTPGAAVADQIFASIDRDGDAQVSGPELEAYARAVLRDLTLELDERSYPLALAATACPSRSEMRAGMGTVRLEAAAGVAVTHGHHRVRFENNHRSDISVYLVNALMPSSRDISIGAQQRDALQHGIRLEFDRATPYTSAAWILFPVLGIAALIACRGRSRTAFFDHVHNPPIARPRNRPIPHYQITQLPD